MRKKQKRRQGQEVPAGSVEPALISSHASQSQEHITLREALAITTCLICQNLLAGSIGVLTQNQKIASRLTVIVI